METSVNDESTGRVAAAQIVRGTARFLTEGDEHCLAEFTLRTGRRVDLIALDRKGKVTIIEVKSSVADFRADQKWHEYLEFCDRFFFAVNAEFPLDLLPDDCGILVADAYGAEVVRASPDGTLNAARRKSLTLKFARNGAARLQRYTDPGWVRG